MQEKFLIAILIIAAAMAELFPGVSAQDAAAKAQQLIAQARAALGGDKLKSLSVTGNYRRTFGRAEMAGEVNYDLLRSEDPSPVDVDIQGQETSHHDANHDTRRAQKPRGDGEADERDGG